VTKDVPKKKARRYDRASIEAIGELQAVPLFTVYVSLPAPLRQEKRGLLAYN
jgi:hypothetical protein